MGAGNSLLQNSWADPGHTGNPSQGPGRKGQLDSPIRAGREALQNFWQRGLSGKALLQQHTQLIDAFLAEVFARCPAAKEGMTLIALGGYGREELFPFSDIDLLLLYEPGVEKRLNEVAEALFYPLWDAGLAVGHGVRTIASCLADADQDFFFQVAMLDARYLAGAKRLFSELQTVFRQNFIEGRRQQFVENIMAHRALRLNRYGLHGYLLEPHIKEGRGGLRDIQSMLWTAQVVFGLHGLAAMEDAGLLTGTERQFFERACDHLVQIRNRLHYCSGRKNEQLYFEYQEEIAATTGYRDAAGLLGVEQFMRKVHDHLQYIAKTVDLFFEHVQETLDQSLAREVNLPLEPGLEIRRGRLLLADQHLLKKRPYLLMRIFAQAARNGLPIHHLTRKYVTAHLHLVDDRLRRSRRMAAAFFDALQDKAEPLRTLGAMLDCGLLTAYIPEFAPIESLAQHDIYHVYTVDRHLVQTVVELNNIRQEEPAIFQAVSSPHILYLAALLHDLGKGKGRSHSEQGALLVKEIGKRLQLPDAEIEALAFLVSQHLFLLHTALRRDLDDETLILRCARLIANQNQLSMLYLLSEADARATGPKVWNEWKAALLKELYLRIAHLLDRTDLINPDRNAGVEWMLDQIARLLPAGAAVDIHKLPEDYLLNFPPAAVCRHIELSRSLQEQEVLLVPENMGSSWSLLILARDRIGLLAKICGTLALHNLNVLAAQIFTWPDGTAVDVLHVQTAVGIPYEEQDWQALEKDLHLALGNKLGIAHRLGNKKSSPPAPGTMQQVRQQKAKVVIDNQSSDFYSIIEVYAEDHPGLLYEITKTLSEFGLNIHRARIGSAGDQLVDVFYVLDHLGQKIHETRLQEEIRQELLHAAS